MTDTTGISAKFQFLSSLLDSSSSIPTPLESLLQELVELFDLRAAGVRWPAQGESQLTTQVGIEDRPQTTEWGPEVAAKIGSARSTGDFIVERASAERMFIPLIPEGKSPGVFWAVRQGDGDQSDGDVQAISLAVQLLARSQDFLERIGRNHDTARIAQRLQDASTIAGKIAHDFDNIFTGVVGFADMVLPMLEPGSMPYQYIAEVSAAGNRGIQFTQQLHQFARSGAAKPMPSTLATAVTKEETRLRKGTPNYVRFQTQIAPDLPAIAIESGNLQLVLGHIIDNAVEASPQRGIVRLDATLVELSETDARGWLGNVSAGSFVLVRVRDDGPGIREDYRRRVFVEPFFTTKVRHRGLGLPLVYRVMTAHRGGVRVESTSERGTTIALIFPLTTLQAETKPS